jgi:hypothetical protein
MSLPYAKTPIPHPALLCRYDDLETSDNLQTPAAAGFDEGKLPRAERPDRKQEVFVNLFFARYFYITGEQMAVAIGTDALSAPDDKAYRDTETRLSNMWWSMREKMFGKGSYLDELAQHMVELSNFEVITFNLARQEQILDVHPAAETVVQGILRLDRREEYREAKEEHIARLSASRAEAVVKAQAALNLLEHHDREKAATAFELKRARMNFKHHQDQNKAWRPSMAGHPTNRDILPLKITYTQMTDPAKQEFWAKVWSLDVGANMLWLAKDFINIPGTLKEGEYFYKAVFTIFANDLWKIYDYLEEEKYRAEQVYVNMGGVNEHRSADLKPGRKRLVEPSFPEGFNFSYKKKKVAE